MKSYTDLQQSKKLAEILPLESADMYYGYKKDKPEYLPYSDTEVVGLCFPCWSLSALMNLLPSEFTEKGKYSETKYNIHIRKYALTEDVDLHQIAYGSYKWHEDGSCSWSDMINTGEKEDLLDAVFQMVVWLKENGKL